MFESGGTFRVSFKQAVVMRSRNGTVGFVLSIETRAMHWTEEVCRMKADMIAFADGQQYMADEVDGDVVVPFHNLAGWQFFPDEPTTKDEDGGPDSPAF